MAEVLIRRVYSAFAVVSVAYSGRSVALYYRCYNQSVTCMMYGNSKLRCMSMIFHIATYQHIVMPYQACYYNISALWQATYQGRYRSTVWQLSWQYQFHWSESFKQKK